MKFYCLDSDRVLKDITVSTTNKKVVTEKNGIKSFENVKYSNTIYTFDTETTSLFYINGEWKLFDYSIPPTSDLKKGIVGYDRIPKSSCCYMYMFSINNVVYYSRHIESFIDVLKQVSSHNVRKIIYVHNLGFDFQIIRWLFKNYHIVDLVARKSRTPIKFVVEELNIEFRCSLRLTELNLYNASKQYGKGHVKAKGDIDYNVIRSPLTKLTDQELYYCYMDCFCLYYIIKTFRDEYGSLANIPLTQTGEMRYAFKKVVPKSHYELTRKMIPTVEEFKILDHAFWGGITHANALRVDDVFKAFSVDFSSSYPYVMVSEKYPMEAFHEISVDSLKNYDNDSYAILYDLTFTNINSKLYNHFLSFSKLIECVGEYLDNGRLICADMVRVQCTDVDFNLIKKSYTYDDISINKVYVAKKDYLPDYFVNFILDLYGRKTKLKNVSGMDEIYMKKKQILNSAFGACCTNIVKSTVIYDNFSWKTGMLTDRYIELKLSELFKQKNLFPRQWGVYVTAYARRNLWLAVINYDYDVIYYDTDSLKLIDSANRGYIENYNYNVKLRLMTMCNRNNIEYSKCVPKNKDGKVCMIGEFADDGDYLEFKTLGAKRYIARDKKDRKLHLTVAGIPKTCVDYFKDNVNNFTSGCKLGYKESRKMLSCYIDEQPEITFTDIDGNTYTSHQETGIVLMPTTFNLDFDTDFERYVSEINEAYNDQSEDFLEIYKTLR